MQEAKQLSTQVGCNEEWRVNTGDDSFILNPEQIDVLKKATLSGKRGIVWFDKFAISIPHIASIKRIKKEYWEKDGAVERKISRSEYESKQKALKGEKVL